MAVTYTNNWKNIMLALKSKLRAEIKCPIFSGFDAVNKSNQFIKLIPTGSSQIEKATFMESREFNIDIQYYMLRRNNAQFEDYVFNQVSILEALVHDNIALTLSASTRAHNLSLETMELDVEEEDFEDYFIVQWALSLIYTGNQG